MFSISVIGGERCPHGYMVMEVVEGPGKHGSREMGPVEGRPKNLTKTKKKSKRVLLISPPFRRPQYVRYRSGENLGIRYIASYLKKHGHSAEVFEPSVLRLSIKDTAKFILKEDYDLVGFTVPYGGLYPNIVKVIRTIRDHGFEGHVTLGGHFATFEHKDILRYNKNVDSVVRHEGEITLLELVSNLEDKNLMNILGLSYRVSKQINVNSPRPLIKNLDYLPFPKRDEKQNNENNHFTMITSRGCYGNCSFCSIRAFYGFDSSLWRYRSPKNVVDEIEHLVNNYNAKVISFMDDNFIGSGKHGKKRAIEIANEIIDRGISIYFEISCRPDDISAPVLKDLKKAGLRHISVGIESGNNQVLKRFNKKTTVTQNIKAIKTLRRVSISFTPYFIMFDPYTTIEELRDNLDFLYTNKICTYRTVKNAITIYKGTPYYTRLKSNLKRAHWEYQYDFEDVNVAKIYYIVDSLGELNTLDKLFDILVYHRDTKKNLHQKGSIAMVMEDLSNQTNEFVYNIMMEIINRTIKYPSGHNSIFQIKEIQNRIHTFTEHVRNYLLTKGVGWVLKELEDCADTHGKT